MRKVVCLIFVIMISCLNFSYVQAACSEEEIDALKKEAREIKITYEHLGVLEENGTEVYDKFLVVASNINDDFYIHLSPFATEDFVTEGETLKINLTTGTWHYLVYSSKCATQISDIEVNLPRFNIYSLDSLCEGIDGDDFSLCGKYYKYEVAYETFVERVTAYRTLNNIDNIEDSNDEENFLSDILNKVLDFISTYRIYILLSLGVILLIISIILITSKSRRRKVLK